MEYSLPVALVPAETAYIGGVAGAHMENALTITGQKQSHTIERIRTSRLERDGATGTSRENRHIGAGEGHFIQYITAINS